MRGHEIREETPSLIDIWYHKYIFISIIYYLYTFDSLKK